ncbi:MAPEG family protein [Simiduia curdlanivorans]|uniref:Microsomal glutathione S-transferase 1 n=1 Tax=Simiduia curdlanivorans TaxID=1492769 RepID=A0ABV8V521_9GAMM
MVDAQASKEKKGSTQGANWIIKVYPFGVLLLSLVLCFVLGIQPTQAAVPTNELLGILTLAAAILILNHSWVMTATELTRHKYKVYASPEERKTHAASKADVSDEGINEIERHLNTHRNTTENTIYYIFLAIIFSLASPSLLAAWVWLLLFPIARLGYTYSYFAGNDNLRGVFMSLTLLSTYGMASYLALSFLFR